MSRLTTLLFVIFILCTPVSAQCRLVATSLEKINDEERGLLRKSFKLPDAATISEVKDKTFPPAAPLKVRIETIFDPTVRQLVTDWINEWNQKEAEKYGKLDIAPDRLQADVSVLRYSHRPATGLMGKVVLTCTDPNGKVQRLIPIYSYLIVEKSEGLEILWRKAYLTYQEEHEFAARLLTDQLKKLMKHRAKH
jgi:hypothetical protein